MVSCMARGKRPPKRQQQHQTYRRPRQRRQKDPQRPRYLLVSCARCRGRKGSSSTPLDSVSARSQDLRRHHQECRRCLKRRLRPPAPGRPAGDSHRTGAAGRHQLSWSLWVAWAGRLRRSRAGSWRTSRTWLQGSTAYQRNLGHKLLEQYI